MCSSTVARVLLQTQNLPSRHLQDEANGEDVGGCCLEQQPFVGVHRLALQKTIMLKNFRVMSHRDRRRLSNVCEHAFRKRHYSDLLSLSQTVMTSPFVMLSLGDTHRGQILSEL